MKLLRSIAAQFMTSAPDSENNPYRADAFANSDARGQFEKFLADELTSYPELGLLSERLEGFRIENQIYGHSLPGCYRGSSYAHVESFRDFLQKRGYFPAVMEFLTSDTEEVDPVTCAQALQELPAIRELIASTAIAAIEILDEKGQILATYSYDGDQRYGNSASGYGFRLEHDAAEWITIEHKAPDIFSVPPEQYREFVKQKDLGGLIEAANRLREDAGNFKVVEMWRENGTYRCKLINGSVIDLPAETGTKVAPIKAVKAENAGGQANLIAAEFEVVATPFDGFAEKDKIHRVRIAKTPAKLSFDFFVNLIEKQASIAVKFNIPVTLR